MIRARPMAAWVALLLLLGAAAAGAEEVSDQDKAREHFERGKTLHEEGRYQEAIAELERAHELSRLPALLFNIAQAYRLDGDYAAAIDYYERFLERAPDHPLAEEAGAKLEESREALPWDELEGEDAGSGAGPEGEAGAPPPGGESDGSAGTLEGQGGGADRGARYRAAGVYVAGAGAVALVVGGYFGWRARSISDELSRHEGPWTAELLAKQEDGRAAERNMFIAGGVGLAALSAGATLYFIGRDRKEGEPTVALSPAPAGDGMMVTLRGGLP